jgi:hypothetical protein
VAREEEADAHSDRTAGRLQALETAAFQRLGDLAPPLETAVVRLGE